MKTKLNFFNQQFILDNQQNDIDFLINEIIEDKKKDVKSLIRNSVKEKLRNETELGDLVDTMTKEELEKEFNNRI